MSPQSDEARHHFFATHQVDVKMKKPKKYQHSRPWWPPFIAMIFYGGRRKKCLSNLFRGLLFCILALTLSVNLAFIASTSSKSPPSSKGDKVVVGDVLATAGGHAIDENGSSGGSRPRRRSNQLRLQANVPKFLTIEVLSSQKRVTVTVDGTTVSYTMGCVYKRHS